MNRSQIVSRWQKNDLPSFSLNLNIQISRCLDISKFLIGMTVLAKVKSFKLQLFALSPFFCRELVAWHTYIVLVGKGNKCEFIRPSITNGNSVPGWRGVALLMAVQFLLPTLTCYEKSGNFPRKTSASLKLRTPPRSCLLEPI